MIAELKTRTWNKERLIQFLKQNLNQSISIEQRRCQFKITGVLTHLEEIDLCDRFLMEGCMDLKLPYSSVDITFHRDCVSIHLILSRKGEVLCSVPHEIPYSQIRISRNGHEV